MSLNGGVEVFRARRDAAFAEGKAVIDAAAVVHRGAVWSLSAPARHGDVMRLPGWLYPFDGLIGDGDPKESQGFIARRQVVLRASALDGVVTMSLPWESVAGGPLPRFLETRARVVSEGGPVLVDVRWYVDRVTAAGIAVAAGQIEATRWGPELFSEDLW